MIALLAVVLALVALPSSAVAAVTVTEFEVEQSSLQAGGHPSVTITQSFQYSSATAARCTSEQLRTTAGCPAAAKVGSVEGTARPILAGLPGPMALAVPGSVYILMPRGR